ncbi:MAG TPA: 2-phospho-L-lactate guanylyltransferase [Intrasporangium sp.]|jgi:2-phospho-L-lactate guanylyltransferase CofC|uniref:2-phospho-L-lactate guanylyltransferase n=1 Tax=Intrasporangium sp. TaxID=1925024 RepID=UPI002F92C4D1
MSEPGSDTPTTGLPQWHLVIPVKDAAVGKSRLARALAGVEFGAGVGSAHRADRETIGRALARDTLRAACLTVGPARVVLVTADEVIAAEFRDHGVTTVRDAGVGLNAAVTLGLARTPPGGRVAVLLGDLPALTPADLGHALEAASAHGQSFVPDADGSGTVLRASSGGPVGHFTPRFGPGSAARHAADGAARLELDLPRLRTDVDDLRSLVRVLELGAGPSTTAALGSLDLLGWAHAGNGPRL